VAEFLIGFLVVIFFSLIACKHIWVGVIDEVVALMDERDE
jgi:hypothetical protein